VTPAITTARASARGLEALRAAKGSGHPVAKLLTTGSLPHPADRPAVVQVPAARPQMKRFIDLPPKLRWYIAGVIGLGFAITALVLFGPVPPEPAGREQPLLLAGLLIWMIVCSVVRLDLVIHGAMMTLGSAAVSLAQISLGTRDAMLVAALGAGVTIVASRMKAARAGRDQSVPLHRWLFNVCNCLVAAGIGGIAYDWVFNHANLGRDQEIVPATIAWVLTYFCLNTVGVAIAISLGAQQPVLKVWRENFLWTAPGYLISAIISALVVFTARHFGVWSLLLIPVIFFSFYSYRQHLDRLAAARQYEGLIESARDGVVILKDGVLLYANEAFAKMVGYPREELVHRNFAGLLAPDETPAPSLAGLGDQQFGEQQLLSADGRLVPVEFSTSPAVYQGRDGCVQALVRDVSERLAAVQAEKLRALGQMASGVAHDFNNSLMVILGNLTLARMALPGEGDPARATAEQRLQGAEQAAQDAATTVRRLQAFGRPGTGSQETVNLRDLAEEVLLMTRPIWRDAPRASGLEVAGEVAGESVYVRANAAELREALTNLISNAVQAMPYGGRLRLTTQREADLALLSVTDTGTGMSAQVRERLFEPFYTTKGEKGSGLGLFVTYGLVTQHGGEIEVVSAPGAGTTFHLRFPSVPAEARREAEEIHPSLVSARVLIVDDDPVVRDVVGSMLRSANLTAREVEDGEAALAALVEEPFDLVITDLSMPDLSGLELAREVRARWPRVPILLLTGWAESPETTGVNLELVDSVLTKPISMSALLRQVTAALAPNPSRPLVGSSKPAAAASRG